MINAKHAMGIETRNFFVKIVPILGKLSATVLVVTSLSILGVALWVNASFARLSVLEMNQGKSSAFQGKDIQDPLREPEATNILAFNTSTYPLEGFVPNHTTILRVSFLYQCNTSCPQLWLTLPTGNDRKNQTLIHHPILDDLPWFVTIDNGLTFYQKELTYHTIADLVQANPLGMLTEKGIAQGFDWNSHHFNYLEDTHELTDQHYIITTREPVRKFKQWYRYTKLVDISGIPRDDAGNIVFFIEQNPTNSKLQSIKVANINIAILPK
jgi:hypothetical protein